MNCPPESRESQSGLETEIRCCIRRGRRSRDRRLTHQALTQRVSYLSAVGGTCHHFAGGSKIPVRFEPSRREALFAGLLVADEIRLQSIGRASFQYSEPGPEDLPYRGPTQQQTSPRVLAWQTRERGGRVSRGEAEFAPSDKLDPVCQTATGAGGATLPFRRHCSSERRGVTQPRNFTSRSPASTESPTVTSTSAITPSAGA